MKCNIEYETTILIDLRLSFDTLSYRICFASVAKTSIFEDPYILAFFALRYHVRKRHGEYTYTYVDA